MIKPLMQCSLIFALAGATGCDQSLSRLEEGLADAMEKWETQGYVDYSMRFGRSCFCGPGDLEATVHIEAGAVVAFEAATAFDDTLSDSLLVAWDITLSSFKSVQELFGVIEEAIRLDADDIAVTYNGALGYPQLIDIDYNIEIIDEEIVYHASDVVEKL